MPRYVLRILPLTPVFLFGSLVPTWAAGQSGKSNDRQSGAVDTSRDARAHGPTADQQKENRSDRKLTQEIRRAVYKDKSLSTMAHQVKIVTVGGEVTLRGAVRSEEEKRTVEERATAVAGAGKVKSELTISSGNATDKEANKTASKTKH